MPLSRKLEFTNRIEFLPLLHCAFILFQITFGPNMTSLTFHMARSLEDHIKTLPSFPHLNVILSQLCHDANVSPWLRLAENLDGLEVRRLDFNRKSCTIDQSDFDRKLDSKTVLVCLGLASNACGTINPVKQMIKWVYQTQHIWNSRVALVFQSKKNFR